MGGVAYQIEPSLSADEFVDVLRRSSPRGSAASLSGLPAR